MPPEAGEAGKKLPLPASGHRMRLPRPDCHLGTFLSERGTSVLFLHSLAHLLVDALCASVLFGPVVRSGGDPTGFFLIYTTLAFSTQGLAGLAADRIKKHAPAAALSMLTVVLAFVLPLPPLPRVILAGCGNSVFHVAGGAFTLEESRGRAGKLGVFVAPGAVGLTLGTLWPALGAVFAVMLALCAFAEIPLMRRTLSRGISHAGERPIPQKSVREILGPVLMLSMAVAVRATGGSVPVFTWNNGVLPALLLALCVWAGKTAGGFLCDRAGPVKMVLLSVLPAAALISFFPDLPVPSLTGQFALNLTMPVTLWLLYLAMPDSPGFAFGLAASALWPGTIAGWLITLTGPGAWALTCAAFLFGLGAITYAARKLLPQE